MCEEPRACYIGHLDDLYFNLIKNRSKTAELRIFDEKRRKYKTNDLWIFNNRACEGETITVIIKKIKIYSSFEDAIIDDDKNCLLPNVETVDEAVEIYNSFPGYKEKSETEGVVRFDFILIGEK